MNLITLAVVVIAVAVVVQVIVMIPTVMQLKKTLAAGEGFLKSMEGSLKSLIDNELTPTVRSLNSTLQEAEGVAKFAKEGMEKVDDALEAFRHVAGTVRSIDSVIEKAVKTPVVNAAAWITGLKVGIGTLVDALKHSKNKEVE